MRSVGPSLRAAASLIFWLQREGWVGSAGGGELEGGWPRVGSAPEASPSPVALLQIFFERVRNGSGDGSSNPLLLSQRPYSQSCPTPRPRRLRPSSAGSCSLLGGICGITGTFGSGNQPSETGWSWNSHCCSPWRIRCPRPVMAPVLGQPREPLCKYNSQRGAWTGLLTYSSAPILLVENPTD